MTEPVNIVWEDPPPKKRPGSERWDPIIAELRKNPGRWARLAEMSGSTGATTGWLTARYPDCEFTGRGRVIYGRASD